MFVQIRVKKPSFKIRRACNIFRKNKHRFRFISHITQDLHCERIRTTWLTGKLMAPTCVCVSSLMVFIKRSYCVSPA